MVSAPVFSHPVLSPFDRRSNARRRAFGLSYGLLAAVLCAASGASALVPAAVCPAPGVSQPAQPRLIVIGFMGGRVKAGNLVHREALVAQDIARRFPNAVSAAVFANHDATRALATVLRLIDTNGDGCQSTAEKRAARIVIYGHSWGASETVELARRLNALAIPVLLTIQVDSVQKPEEDDALIPANVREAVNFYQTEGLLHGRQEIHAASPESTTILGNFQSSYREAPVACPGYPWFARTFMKQHIEIENDPRVWDRIEALIAARVPAGLG